MKLDFAIPTVESAVGNAASLSAFFRGPERFAGCGIDEAIVDPFARIPSLDQMPDFASQVIARRSDHGKA